MKGKLYYKHGEFCSDTNYPDNKSFSCITFHICDLENVGYCGTPLLCFCFVHRFYFCWLNNCVAGYPIHEFIKV
jgi:hypothetical protein